MTATVVADTRKERNRQQLRLLGGWIGTVIAVPALVVAVAVAVVTANVLAGLAAGVLVYGAVSFVAFRHVRMFGSTVIASLPAATIDDQAEARLRNLVEGLCVAHGVTRPVIRVAGIDSHNAATVVQGDSSRQVVLVVTADLVDALSRMELEGLLAQQLSHVRDGDSALATFVAAVASMPVLGPLLARRAGACLDPHLETAADLSGAAMTRYPPGLAAALGSLRSHGNEVPGVRPSAAHLWIANPLPDGTTEPFVPHPPLADRIEVLSEL